MSVVEDSILEYKASLKTNLKLNSIDTLLLRAITLSLGPSIYTKESANLNLTDNSALKAIKQSFLIKTLGLKDDNLLQDGFEKVKNVAFKNKSSVPTVVFKYLLVEHFDKKDLFLNTQINSTTIENLVAFGIEFIEQQEDIDPEIRAATDSSFQDLLL